MAQGSDFGGVAFVFNRVWSSCRVRDDLLRCAGFKHVVIAEEVASDVGDLKTRVSTPIHVLTLLTAKSVPEGILGIADACSAQNTREIEVLERRPFNGLDIFWPWRQNGAP